METPSPTLLSFNVTNNATPDENGDTYGITLDVKNIPGFIDFLRNRPSYGLDVRDTSDQELAYSFLHQHCQAWLSENAKKPMFIETHTFPVHGEIKYDRTWNQPFVGAVTNLGFDVLPPTEDELMEMYMNYIYGTRLMEEMEAMEAANPQSVAHPELTNPDNRLKG